MEQRQAQVNTYESLLTREQIIYTTLRFIDEEELEWALADCLDLKKKYPHIIAGTR